MGCDHSLLLAIIKIKFVPQPKRTQYTQESKINIVLLCDLSIKQLYERRLKVKIQINPIKKEDSINALWEKLKINIKEAAYEALGTRTVKNNNNTRTPWFRPEIKDKCKDKNRVSHLQNITNARIV